MSNFLRNVTYGYASICITAFLGFISVPLSLKYFGQELYGLFSITNDTLAYLALFNFGVPWAASTIFAKLKDYHNQKTILKKSLLVLTLISILLMVIIILIKFIFPNWINFIGQINHEILHKAKLFIGISIAFYLVKLPFTLFNQLLIFMNKVYLSKLMDTISACIIFLCLCLVVIFKWSIIQYAILTGCCTLIVLLLTAFIFLYNWRDVQFYGDDYQSENVSYRYLFSSSFYFFLNGIGGLLVWNTDSIIISHYLGLEIVAKYAVLFKFFMIIFMLINQIMSAVNPLYPKYFKENNLDILSDLFKLTTMVLPIIGGMILLLIYGFFEPFVYFWTQNTSIYIGDGSCFAIGLYCYFLCITIVPYSVLVVLNFSKNIYGIVLLEALLNIILSVLLIKVIGVSGVIIGTLIAHILTALFLIPRRLEALFPNIFCLHYMYFIKHLIIIMLPCIGVVYLSRTYIEGGASFIVCVTMLIMYLFLSFMFLKKTGGISLFKILKEIIK